MNKLPVPNMFMIGFLVMLTVVQLVLVFEFWSSFDSGGGIFKMIFVGLGVGLALVELVALIVCENAVARGAHVAANIYRCVFVMLFCLNLLGDIGAIVTYTAKDGEQRAADQVRYDGNTTRLTELNTRIAALHKSLAVQEYDIPATSLHTKANTEKERLDEEGISTQTRSWRQNRWAQLESAAKTAEQVEALEAEREGLRGEVSEVGARPSMFHPQFEAIAMICKWMGIETTPDEVRVALALALAIVLRFALAFGYWVATPAVARTTGGSGGGGGARTDDPSTDAEWPWPEPQPQSVQNGAVHSDVVLEIKPAPYPRSPVSMPIGEGVLDILDDVDPAQTTIH